MNMKRAALHATCAAMLSVFSCASVVSADTTAADRPALGAGYESAFEDYARYDADIPMRPWLEANERVNAASTHGAHGRSQETASSVDHAAPAAPTQHHHSPVTGANAEQKDASRVPSNSLESVDAPNISVKSGERAPVHEAHQHGAHASRPDAGSAVPGRQPRGEVKQ
jgi:hypothetical protein